MAKNLNYKKARAIKDSQEKRINDMRSGGEGSLRSSLFNRQDETISEEIQQMFIDAFNKSNEYQEKIGGGDYDAKGKKQVCWYKLQIPAKVQVGNVEALLAKVDYDKDKHIFSAIYRPKNGKWGQAKKTGNKFSDSVSYKKF